MKREKGKVEQLKMKERFQRSSQRKERGITLVALVITIVILIILAVITINFAFGEDGLIAQANRGKEETEIADAREKLSVVLSVHI